MTERKTPSKTAAKPAAAKPAAAKPAAAKPATAKAAAKPAAKAVAAKPSAPAAAAVKTAAKRPAKPAAKPAAAKTAVAKQTAAAPLLSMTGFANSAGEGGGKRINLDLRSVNHRYLDIQFRMPEELRHLEPVLREQIAAAAQRGKIECRIQLQNLKTEGGMLEIDRTLAAALAGLGKQLRKEYAGLGKLTVADILNFPGVVSSSGEDAESLAQAVRERLAEALADFSASRAREGAKLAQHLNARLDAMEEITEALAELFPSLLQVHMDKVGGRLKEAVGNIDNDRLQQEFALFVQKSDVDEELSRLKTHIAEVRRIVAQAGSGAGKRLDFLMQELNREANTLGSKAIAAECTKASVELKVLIEQMREQVQNIE